MKTFLKKFTLVRFLYISLLRLKALVLYFRDYFHYNQLLSAHSLAPLQWKNRYICLDDRTLSTSFDTHYIYHTAWAARILQKIQPAKHVDISSSLFFNAITSAFIPIDFYDYRPANLTLSNLTSHSADLLSLPFLDESVISLSCMHVIEHVGLGRYGDDLDPIGDQKAASELQRVLAANGDLLLVVPVGKATINFNGHRVYAYSQIITMFDQLRLMEFSLLTDDTKGANFIINASEKVANEQTYGCGCFWFKKIKSAL